MSSAFNKYYVNIFNGDSECYGSFGFETLGDAREELALWRKDIKYPHWGIIVESETGCRIQTFTGKKTN